MVKNKLIEWGKNYIAQWNFTRLLRLLLAIALFGAFFSTKEQLYAVVGSFLGMQAILNMSCPGGNCETTPKPTQKQVMKFKKLELKK
jgi:hypothetical protein